MNKNNAIKIGLVYLVVRYIDLGYHVLSAWGSQAEAEAEAEQMFRADHAKNQYVERKDYDVEKIDFNVNSK